MNYRPNNSSNKSLKSNTWSAASSASCATGPPGPTTTSRAGKTARTSIATWRATNCPRCVKRSKVIKNSSNSPCNTPRKSSLKRGQNWPAQKKDSTPQLLLAQDQEIQQVMAHFQAAAPTGGAVQQLEVLVRTAIFKPANQLVGVLLQAAADRAEAAYQPQPGQQRKGRVPVTLQGIFGTFQLQRDYYYHVGKQQGHYPADVALGLEGGY